MQPKPVIVVGAGIGGLVSALELAAAGIDVLVLERADRPGGKMREVSVAGRAMDAGPTVFTMRWVFDELFDRIGARLDDHLTLQAATTLARHAWGADELLDLHADIGRSADAVSAFAGPAEGRGYLDFCARARTIYATLERPFLRGSRPTPLSLVARAGWRGLPDLARISPFATMWGELGRYFADPRLRQLFGRYATYCGSSPFQAPATLMLVAHVEQEGVWLVEGGMHRIARCLADLAAERGAVFRYGAHVDRIDVQGGRASGVRLANGEQIAADAVVFNGDVAALADGRLGLGAVTAAVRKTDLAKRSLSALTWNMSVTTQGFDLLRHTVFFSSRYEAEFEAIFRDSRLPDAPTVYVCAQDRGDHSDHGDHGTTAATDGPERLLCLVNAPARGDGSPLTPKEIDRCEAEMLRTLARSGLQIRGDPAHTLLTTPTDFERLFPATGGALYGQASHGWAASFSRPGSHSRLPGLYLAGGSTHPGPGVPMAALSGRLAAASLIADRATAPVGAAAFDGPVEPGGYAWWYVDALSDDSEHGLTIIAFIGSVFSPYYAWARRRRPGQADPLDHCALNVALYHRSGSSRWAMTERRRHTVTRDASHLQIGPSAMRWDGDSLRIDIDELTVPWPSRLRGSVRLMPAALHDRSFALDGAGVHHWHPIAPIARVEVEMCQPGLRWQGAAYLDSNRGNAALEDDFERWHWSRASLGGPRSAVLYDVTRRGGGALSLALAFDARGGLEAFNAPPTQALPRTAWGIDRQTRCDAGHRATVSQTLENAPFYARSLLATHLCGEPATAVHESLSLPRFGSPWVQAMLPFRMPRAR